MRRRSVWVWAWGSVSGVVLAAMGVGSARADTPPAAADTQHRIVFHVGGSDPGMMSVALRNIANAADDYAERGEAVAIELVANGPGYTMLRADTSPVAAAVAATMRKYPFVVFSACQKTRAGMASAEHKSVADIVQLPGVTDVAAGVVRIVTLQEARYSYIFV